MKIKIANARLSFPSLFNKATFNGEETKFEATLLISKDDKKTKATIDDAIKVMLKENKLKKLPADKICLKDGDDATYDGYEGAWSFKASNHQRPVVLNKDKSPIVEKDGIIYGGCYVNAIVELWFQNNAFGKRINANLLGVQFAKDGDSFASGSVASDGDFDLLDDDDDDKEGDDFT